LKNQKTQKNHVCAVNKEERKVKVTAPLWEIQSLIITTREIVNELNIEKKQLTITEKQGDEEEIPTKRAKRPGRRGKSPRVLTGGPVPSNGIETEKKEK